MGFITQNPVVGGMAAGFISGALKGNPKAMLTGAVIGGATAFVGGQVHAAFGIVGDVGMMGAGVGLSVAKGGPESLAYMAASFAGSMAGYYMTGQGGGRSAGASSGPSERDRDALLQNPYCEDPNFDEQFSEIQQRLTDLTSFVPAADVIIGIDSPVGGVNTTFPFQSGDNPSTNWTTPSYNFPLGPGVNAKISGAVDPISGVVQFRSTITSPLLGGRLVASNNGITFDIMGPQVNFPLGFGVNAYVGTKWKN